MNFLKIAGVLAVCVWAQASASATITNGDFENVDQTDLGLIGWSISRNFSGTIGPGRAASFDVTGQGTSFAAAFQVGSNGLLPQGGATLFQVVDIMQTGAYSLSVDVAVNDPFGFGNVDAGTFALLAGGLVIDTFDFGAIGANETERARLVGSFDVIAPGTFGVGVRVTRTSQGGIGTPFQFVDNFVLTGPGPTPVPLPAGLPLLLVGLGSFGWLRFRQKKR